MHAMRKIYVHLNSDPEKVSDFETIRDDIHTRYPALAELVEEQFPQNPRGADAFKYAMELYLRAISNLDAAVDGFTHLNVVEETRTKMRIVGISYVLPSSLLPIDATFRIVGDVVEYQILVGIDDDLWKRLSESKRWKVVYQYANQGDEAEWNWEQLVEGQLDG